MLSLYSVFQSHFNCNLSLNEKVPLPSCTPSPVHSRSSGSFSSLAAQRVKQSLPKTLDQRTSFLRLSPGFLRKPSLGALGLQHRNQHCPDRSMFLGGDAEIPQSHRHRVTATEASCSGCATYGSFLSRRNKTLSGRQEKGKKENKARTATRKSCHCHPMRGGSSRCQKPHITLEMSLGQTLRSTNSRLHHRGHEKHELSYLEHSSDCRGHDCNWNYF